MFSKRKRKAYFQAVGTLFYQHFMSTFFTNFHLPKKTQTIITQRVQTTLLCKKVLYNDDEKFPRFKFEFDTFDVECTINLPSK